MRNLAHNTLGFTLGIVLMAASTSSWAHIGYGGRAFGTILAGTSSSIATQSVTSNYGWADASDRNLVFNSSLAATPRTDEATFISGTGSDDLYLGDSHKGRAFSLHLDSTLAVTIAASSRNSSGLTAAFSVYQGLAATSPFTAPQTSADHDYATASQAWRSSFAQGVAGSGYDHLATNGSWNALGNWSIGGDGDTASGLDSFVYKGSAFSTVANGTASTTLTLGPGDYTIFVGGNDIGAKSVANSAKSYAFTLGVSAVTAVPEPQAALLMLLGLPLLALRRRRAAHA